MQAARAAANGGGGQHVMLQEESAPTSDNEHDVGRGAVVGGAAVASTLAGPHSVAPFGESLLVEMFPWGDAPPLGVAAGDLTDASWGAGGSVWANGGLS